MPKSVTLRLEPDPEQDANLRGKYDAKILAKAPSRGSIDYEVLSSVAVHGRATINGREERASLLVFEVGASAPRKRPIESMSIQLVFEKSPAKPDIHLAPRLVKILPDKRGYKVKCVEGTTKSTRTRAGKLNIRAGFDIAGAEIEGQQEQQDEIDKPIEFYTFVRGFTRPSDNHHKMSNSAYWNFEGDDDNKGSVPPVVHIALLLLRPADGEFTCEAKVQLTVDYKYSLENRMASLWHSPPGPIRYDPMENDMPDKPVSTEHLDEFLDEARLKELVEIMMPLNYETWKYEKGAQVDEDV